MESSGGRSYEEEASDQPVDYSKKYTERNTLTQSRTIDDSPRAERKKEFSERETKVDLFGDYAETDLDQPTDYSLRYAEDDTDDDEKQSPEYFPGSVQEDTVKTYCTEGTPYETPFNFSTATSMSDLRVEEAKENVDPPKKLVKKPLEVGQKEGLPFKRTVSLALPLPLRCEESQPLMNKEAETAKSPRPMEGGQVTPEKIVNYYEGGTPDGFSRANSLSSLGSAITQQNNVGRIMPKGSPAESRGKVEVEAERNPHSNIRSNVSGLRMPSETNSPTDGKNNGRVVDKEGKMVTFGGQDFYAEQTPLMFSRCSSLGSLSGFEQHSIHDDRSSVVSDFSRRTSGVVSPSELPDSPTQTIPPSPRNHKSQCTDFISKIQEEAGLSRFSSAYSKSHVTRSSVFEDDIATFKEESTPIEFSTATSLSSLTIDDEIKSNDRSKTEPELEENSADLEKEENEAPREKPTNVETEKDQEQVSDGDEDDEDMLAACISMGMQNNRYRQSFKTSNAQKPIQPEPSNVQVRYQRTSTLNRLEPRVPVTSTETATTSTKTSKTAMEVVAGPDTVHVYCTEDTPADISPVGSQSNLSALSMPSVQEDVERTEEGKTSGEVECHRNDLSDESSNLSGEDEKILDECIQSGMPKVRQITPPPACIPFVQKTEALTQRFNICGTPSSSPVESGHANKNPIHGKPLCRATIERENELSDDSPNHSDDEAILTECIRSAMPKVRLNISRLVGPSLPQPAEEPKVSNPRKPAGSSSYFSPARGEQNKQPVKKAAAFEDNLSLSEEEEDVILAQCIRSGMPKAVNASSTSPPPSTKKPERCAKPRSSSSSSSSFYFVNKSCPPRHPTMQPPRKPQESDAPTPHIASSSSNFPRFPPKPSESNSARGSLRNGVTSFEGTSSSRRYSHSENEQRIVLENILSNSRGHAHCRSPIPNGADNDEEEPCRAVKSNVVPSRHSSVSSLSEEGSLGSIEEWALLELCISSGMPRNKYRLKSIKSIETTISNSHEDREPLGEDNYSICSYNSYVCKT